MCFMVGQHENNYRKTTSSQNTTRSMPAWLFSHTKTITPFPLQEQAAFLPNNPNQNANSQDQKLSCWTESTAQLKNLS